MSYSLSSYVKDLLAILTEHELRCSAIDEYLLEQNIDLRDKQREIVDGAVAAVIGAVIRKMHGIVPMPEEDEEETTIKAYTPIAKVIPAKRRP